MNLEPDSSRTIHVIRQPRPTDIARPFNYLISYGGSKEPGGVFSLGTAYGQQDLVGSLGRLGVSEEDVCVAVEVLTVQDHHAIPGVVLSRELLRQLGLK